MAAGMSSVRLTWQFHFVTACVMPTKLVSWKASVPSSDEPTCPVTSTSGVESISASASPVTVFVAPGPEVTRQTPTRPLTRA